MYPPLERNADFVNVGLIMEVKDNKSKKAFWKIQWEEMRAKGN